MNKPIAKDVLAELGFMQWLIDQGYRDPRPIGNDMYAAIIPLLFTHAIITGYIFNKMTTENRWCFAGYEKAKAALEAWNPATEPEPTGWHRHPASGRRRNVETGEEWVDR